MTRGRTIFGWVTVATAIVLGIAACGRNWCIGGFGPCDQFNNMDPKEAAKLNAPTNLNTCGYQTTGNPRNGLQLNYALQSPTRPATQTNINVSGGTPPYRVIMGNNLSSVTPIVVADNNTNFTFIAGNSPGFACFKIVDSTMRDTDQCDTCSAQIQISVPAFTGTRR